MAPVRPPHLRSPLTVSENRTSALGVEPAPVWLFGSSVWVRDAVAVLTENGTPVRALPAERIPPLSDPDPIPLWRELLREAVREAGGEPGWVLAGDSLWADRPDWQRAMREVGLRPAVAPATALHRSANRLTFLLAAESMAIPTLLAHEDPFASAAEAWAWLQSQTRDGPGTWVLKSTSQLEEGFGVFPMLDLSPGTRRDLELWFRQVQERSGNHLAFVEKHREAARLIDVGFVRSGSEVWIAPWVDSSLRVKGRRWILTCPAREQAEQSAGSAGVEHAVKTLARELDWQGWGQARFLIEGGEFYLLDLTARMFASDRLAEWVSGDSILENHFQAFGVSPRRTGRLRTPGGSGTFAAAVAVSAENPVTGVPQPGVATDLSSESEVTEALEAGALTVELKLALQKGERLSIEGDGLIAWVRSRGPSRDAVLQGLRAFLAECLFAGSFHANDAEARLLLEHPWVREDCVHADFLDQDYLPRTTVDSGRLQRWAGALDRFRQVEGKSLPPEGWVIADRKVSRGPEAAPEAPGLIVVPLSSGAYRLREEGVTALARPASPRGGVAQIRALCAGRVQAIFYREGGEAPPHESVVVLESLARLVSHASPRRIRVLKWHVRPEQEVEAWELLADVELLPLSPA